jgi:hypothetical protein
LEGFKKTTLNEIVDGRKASQLVAVSFQSESKMLWESWQEAEPFALLRMVFDLRQSRPAYHAIFGPKNCDIAPKRADLTACLILL